jgi:hypothetical protein
VCGLYFLFVGQLYKDSVVCGSLFGAGIVDVQEMACASCVGNCIVICGQRTMISLRGCICPNLSSNFLFVGIAPSFGVGWSGFALMSFNREVATLAGVGVVDVESMCPTVVVICVALFGGVTIACVWCRAVAVVVASSMTVL